MQFKVGFVGDIQHLTMSNRRGRVLVQSNAENSSSYEQRQHDEQ